ncbi:hypothetical protein [uncultured Desulfuromusa sp.]|uniref:serine O-acetyltransferase n=1 Tax=uncultured Desulfuromusa sp. TaxID=219183 RepID=UPI002AA68737|nr:hypothetical protein [uncultured Desulfuromusa sp.]
MKFHNYKDNVVSDLYRYCGKKSIIEFFKNYIKIPGFRYTFWMRTAKYLKGIPVIFPLYVLSRIALNRLQYRYGISIPYNTTIGPGLYVGHFGGIIVNHEAVIGNNCNINQNVTIGATYGGKSPGNPTIGNNVYIGPGSFIIGGIEIGDNVAIGANTVVNKTIGENAVVVSSAAEIISHKSSSSYVVNTDY